jgi:pfkB family carbohydrate kinase
VIVVAGRPVLGPGERGRPAQAGGHAFAIALAAARAGGSVQFAGKVGTDETGDAVLLELAAAGIGHVAVLRDPSISTATDLSDRAAGQSPEPADLDLALRYLTSFGVLIVVDSTDPAVLAVASEAAAYAGARLIVVSARGDVPVSGLETATVLEAPERDPDGAFAGLVGRFAVALDRGEPADAAFRAALGDGGWETVIRD